MSKRALITVHTIGGVPVLESYDPDLGLPPAAWVEQIGPDWQLIGPVRSTPEEAAEAWNAQAEIWNVTRGL